MASPSFPSLGLAPPVLEGLRRARLEGPSPVQRASIPLGRFGADVVVQAKAGSGKTCALAVVIVEMVDLAVSAPQALVLAPTRERAVYARDVVRAVGAATAGLSCHAFIGGVAADDDRALLEGSNIHVATGTPGRLRALLEEDRLPSRAVRLWAMLDADRLCAGPFMETMYVIHNALPPRKQILAFADMDGSQKLAPGSLRRLVRIMRTPQHVRGDDAEDDAWRGAGAVPLVLGNNGTWAEGERAGPVAREAGQEGGGSIGGSSLGDGSIAGNGGETGAGKGGGEEGEGEGGVGRKEGSKVGAATLEAPEAAMGRTVGSALAEEVGGEAGEAKVDTAVSGVVAAAGLASGGAAAEMATTAAAAVSVGGGDLIVNDGSFMEKMLRLQREGNLASAHAAPGGGTKDTKGEAGGVGAAGAAGVEGTGGGAGSTAANAKRPAKRKEEGGGGADGCTGAGGGARDKRAVGTGSLSSSSPVVSREEERLAEEELLYTHWVRAFLPGGLPAGLAS
jgi:hypothetical protein